MCSFGNDIYICDQPNKNKNSISNFSHSYASDGVLSTKEVKKYFAGS